MINLEQFYACVGGDFGEVMDRFSGNEDMIKRFLKKFLEDESFSLLEKSMETGDVKSAFRGAHSLKGVASNLDLKNLYSVSFDITEILRAEKLEEAKKSFPEVSKEYTQACDFIRELE